MKRNGNTVLITGGGTGIGLSMAETFLNEGNEVIICGRTQVTLDEAKKRFPKLNTIAADISAQTGREIVAMEIGNRFPKLNVLVNNAGIYSVTDIMHPNYIGTLKTELETNLVAPIALIKELMPILEKQSEATIVNVTSGYVFIPSAQSSAYSASKSALRAITQGLRFNLRKTKIRLVEVVPPAVDTKMNKGKNISLMTSELFAQKVFKGLINGQDEIIVGASKLGKLLSRLAPKLGFNKMNTEEEKQRNSVGVN
ncbi:SDR family NAD(P)-dependent oxidoreductase [Flavobacterium sp. CLA17]|uniref:SDR family NAD(P)-dependent oxidoreductase n=1 Tax=Flavobacterium sp. CLA17 TaxID=2724135 RepID=UPI001490D032|nr:SDR family NAD(P)-dependent oxidoreductase [Flavobacterium sp. CLA17]QSB28816.1 SDR family NAD(P)-dependent oxidoreductase [Flavobacterium sp. CLA17]